MNTMCLKIVGRYRVDASPNRRLEFIKNNNKAKDVTKVVLDSGSGKLQDQNKEKNK